MGRLLAPFGVQGWLKARAFTESPETLLGYHRWWLAKDGEAGPWQVFSVSVAKEHSGTLVAKLDGLDDRDAAAAWRGAFIGVPRDALEDLDDDELYWSDCIGMSVVNRNGEHLGNVAAVLDTGAHPVLEVSEAAREGEAGGRTRLIPFVAAYIDGVERTAREILVDWPVDY